MARTAIADLRSQISGEDVAGRLGAIDSATGYLREHFGDVRRLALGSAQGSPLFVEVTNPAEVGDVAAAVDDAGAALHADLWFLIGVATSMLGAYGLYRLVMPRA